VAIQFRCACGKQMQAKEEFAGRKYRCPQCAKIVRIPTPKAKQQPAAPVAAKPATPPLAKPVSRPPLAKPVPARTATVAVPRKHPWVDHSLVQAPTPWLPGDEARFQAGIKPMREGLKCWEKLVLTVLIVGGGAGAIVAANFWL